MNRTDHPFNRWTSAPVRQRRPSETASVELGGTEIDSRLMRASRVQVVLADAIDQQDQPLDRLSLQDGEISPASQIYRRWPEVGPASVEIDQVARGNLLSFVFLAIAARCAHTESLVQNTRCSGVKKT